MQANRSKKMSPAKFRAKILAASISRQYFAHVNINEFEYEAKFRRSLVSLIYPAMVEAEDEGVRDALTQERYRDGYKDGMKAAMAVVAKFKKGKSGVTVPAALDDVYRLLKDAKKRI